MIKMEEQEEGVRGRIGNTKQEKACAELKPYIYCILANICLAGFNIVSKVSLDKGMSRYVLVAYGHAFGTLATALLAFLFERLPFIFYCSVMIICYPLSFFHHHISLKEREKYKEYLFHNLSRFIIVEITIFISAYLESLIFPFFFCMEKYRFKSTL